MRVEQIAGRGQIHAFALNGFDDERGDVALFQFLLQRREIVERNRAAIRQERRKAVAETVVAIDGQRAGAQAVKRFFAMDERGFAGGALGVFDGGLHAFRAGIGEEHHVQLVRHPLFQFGGEQAGKQRRLHLHEARILGIQKFLEDAADFRVIAAQAEHAVAGQQVEIFLALHVPQIRPLGAE